MSTCALCVSSRRVSSTPQLQPQYSRPIQHSNQLSTQISSSALSFQYVTPCSKATRTGTRFHTNLRTNKTFCSELPRPPIQQQGLRHLISSSFLGHARDCRFLQLPNRMNTDATKSSHCDILRTGLPATTALGHPIVRLPSEQPT